MQQRFSLGDLETIHLAIDMAQRFVRGEHYHGDKPQLLAREFDTVMEKVRDLRHEMTYALEDRSLLRETVQDADRGNSNPSI